MRGKGMHYIQSGCSDQDIEIRWRLIGQGEGINWPDLDEDISVEKLIVGKPSNESPASLRRWLDQRRSSPSSTAV